jgi:hypothetical protein
LDGFIHQVDRDVDGAGLALDLEGQAVGHMTAGGMGNAHEGALNEGADGGDLFEEGGTSFFESVHGEIPFLNNNAYYYVL